MIPLLMVAAAITPQYAPGSASLAVARTTGAAPADKKVCRSTTLVGSHIPKRICHTAAEWHAIDNADEVNRSRIMQGRHSSGK